MSLCPTTPCPPVEECPGIACCPENPFAYQVPAHGFCNTEQCAISVREGCEGCKVVIPACTYFSDVSQEDADAQALAAAQLQADTECAPITYYNTRQCVLCPTIDNGSDPVLGPPNPPFFYQAWATMKPDNTVHLEWTVPTFLIEVSTVLGPGHVFTEYTITVTNYLWPAWNSGTTYIQNQRASEGGIRYYSLVDNNTNHQPSLSPTFWAVDPTLFELWWYDFDTELQYIVIGNSDNTAAPATWDWGTMHFNVTFVNHTPPKNFVFYITATANAVTVYSNQFSHMA